MKRKNNRWFIRILVMPPSNVRHTVMVLGVVSSKNQPRHPSSLNSTELQEIFIKPRIDHVCYGRSAVLSRTLHLLTKMCWTTMITPNMWTSKSQDLNHFDYYICGFVKRVNNQRSHNTTDVLKAAITRIISNINTDNAFMSTFSAPHWNHHCG